MEIDDILKLMEAFSQNGLTGFTLEEDGKKLSLKKEKKTVIRTMQMEAGQAVNQLAAQPLNQLENRTVPCTGVSDTMTSNDGTPSAIDSDKVIVSPLVGTFYDLSSPDADCFVKVGDCVKKGQILGIIEAMKLMNEIESEYDGVVEAILVKSEEVVEYGQPLFRIK